MIDTPPGRVLVVLVTKRFSLQMSLFDCRDERLTLRDEQNRCDKKDEIVSPVTILLLIFLGEKSANFEKTKQ